MTLALDWGLSSMVLDTKLNTSPYPEIPCWAAGHSQMPPSSPRSPESDSLLRLASDALQTSAIGLEPLHGPAFRTCRLYHPSGFFYVFRERPLTSTRLLTDEEHSLHTEVRILNCLHDSTDLAVPQVIAFHGTSRENRHPYLISGPFRGFILSEIKASLDQARLAEIHWSLGRYALELSQTVGSSKQKFGTIDSYQSASCSSSWGQCFASLVEAVLCDGENALISLPYSSLRTQLRRHQRSLNLVTRPKLMLLEMAAECNTVVDVERWQVSGLLNFSTAMWGDPYLSDCFHRPSASFIEGYGELPSRDSDVDIRQHLYVIYHSLLAIVRHCYRPSDGEGELEARRDLTMALQQLIILSS